MLFMPSGTDPIGELHPRVPFNRGQTKLHSIPMVSSSKVQSDQRSTNPIVFVLSTLNVIHFLVRFHLQYIKGTLNQEFKIQH